MASRAEIESFLLGLNFQNVGPIGQGTGYQGVYKVEENRTQVVWVILYDVWMSVLSPFAKLDQIDEYDAVRQPTAFGLKVMEDHYCLTDTVPIIDLDESEITLALEVLPGIADGLEKELFGTDKL